MKILTYEDLSTLVGYQKEKIDKIESAWQDAELRAEKEETRIKELEGVIYDVLHSGTWYPSALEIDMHKTEGMCGESLEAMMKEALGE